MSEAKVFKLTGIACQSQLISCSSAEPDAWVAYTDYARLKAELRGKVMDSISDIGQLGEQSAEIAHLKAEVERLTNLKAKADQSETEVNRLKAEVERLRKAGDAMAKRTEFFQKRWDADELCQEVEAWQAAKEGKPSV